MVLRCPGCGPLFAARQVADDQCRVVVAARVPAQEGEEAAVGADRRGLARAGPSSSGSPVGPNARASAAVSRITSAVVPETTVTGSVDPDSCDTVVLMVPASPAASRWSRQASTESTGQS